jgi:hypothetical protein
MCGGSAVKPIIQTSPTEIEFFQAIGEFIVWFSQLEFTIRARLSAALKLDDTLFNVVIAPYDFATLCNVAEKTLKQIPSNAPASNAIERYFNKCRKLNQEARLIIAHGTWAGGARHVSRNTLKASIHFSKPADVQQQTKIAYQLMQELFSLEPKAPPKKRRRKSS